MHFSLLFPSFVLIMAASTRTSEPDRQTLIPWTWTFSILVTHSGIVTFGNTPIFFSGMPIFYKVSRLHQGLAISLPVTSQLPSLSRRPWPTRSDENEAGKCGGGDKSESSALCERLLFSLSGDKGELQAYKNSSTCVKRRENQGRERQLLSSHRP